MGCLTNSPYINLYFLIIVLAIYAVRPNSNTGNIAEPTILSPTLTAHVALSAKRTIMAVLSLGSISGIYLSLAVTPEPLTVSLISVPLSALAASRPVEDDNLAMV